MRDASWSYLLGVSFFIVCVGIAFKAMAPLWLHPLARQVLVFGPLAPIMAKLFANVPWLVERAGEAMHEPVEVAAMWRGLAAPIVASCRYQLVTWRGFVGWALRAPAPALPEGERFGFLERSSYSTFVAICVFSTLVDLPLNGFILSVMVHDPHKRHVLHLILAPLAIYMLYWIISDRWLMRASSHVLTSDALVLTLGGRSACRIPLDAIERCEHVSEAYLSWCARHKVRRRNALAVTPFDRPNVLLLLKHGASATHFGAARTGVSHIFVYVDSAGQLVSSVCQRMQGACPVV
jgi:hypothetical protein